MNKKILILALSLGLGFSSCQTESVSEDVQTEDLSIAKEKSRTAVDTKIHEPVWLEGPGAAIHEPDWLEGPTANIHVPDWIAAMAWFQCGDEYTGDLNLTVNKNNPASYSSPEDGMVNLKNLNVGGELSFCGLLAIENTVNIHRAGVFQLAGEMVVGTKEKPADLVINSGAHLNFAGKITVSGDLIINRGATVEIYGEGEGEVLTVGGNIQISEDAIIEDHREHTHEH